MGISPGVGAMSQSGPEGLSHDMSMTWLLFGHSVVSGFLQPHGL